MSAFKLPDKQAYHAVWSNYTGFFVTNFKFILFLLPTLVFSFCFLLFGGLIFVLLAFVGLIFAAPAVTAMYDYAYQRVQKIPEEDGRQFFSCYKEHFIRSALTMAIQLPFLSMLVLAMLTQAQTPMWVTMCIGLAAVMLMAFSILAFSQIALTDLTLPEIWKNAVVFIPLTGWRTVAAALGQIICLAMFLPLTMVMLTLFILSGPAVLLGLTANLLFPSLNVLLPGETG